MPWSASLSYFIATLSSASRLFFQPCVVCSPLPSLSSRFVIRPIWHHAIPTALSQQPPQPRPQAGGFSCSAPFKVWHSPVCRGPVCLCMRSPLNHESALLCRPGPDRSFVIRYTVSPTAPSALALSCRCVGLSYSYITELKT
jgi:hypothetical protein